MIDHARIYDLIYALAARDGRDKELFGDCGPLAYQAFERSLATESFPELWFELPLTGEPWFDLHALTSRAAAASAKSFDAKRCGGHPELFEWFAQSVDTRQLALSYDVSKGDIEHPAVQLLLDTRNDDVVCDFLAAAGREDLTAGYRAFANRLPEGYYACYSGVFPGRAMGGVRVECIPLPRQQRGYAHNPALLADDLGRLGISVDDEMGKRLQLLSRARQPIEFQFDVDEQGMAGKTFSASLRFPPYTQGLEEPYGTQGATAELMQTIEGWGLADQRWRTLASCTFAKRIAQGDEAVLTYCYPAFIKLKWHGTDPVDCKTYLRAGVYE